VSQYLAERRTVSQQFAGQSMAKLMCAVSRGINACALQPMSNDRSNATSASKTADGRSGTEEDSPTGALRPAVSQICGDRLANVRGQGQPTTLPGLAPNTQLPCFPIDVIEFEKGNLTCAQPQSGEHEQDGVIAAAYCRGAVDTVQHLPDLIRRDRSWNRCHRPMGHDWNGSTQI
jgi:hypothetical protein